MGESVLAGRGPTPQIISFGDGKSEFKLFHSVHCGKRTELKGQVPRCSVSVPMPVMCIREMRMGMRQRRMLVLVLVARPWCYWLGMRMGVVHIATLAVDIAMAVLMVVQQRLVPVLVAMPFGQVQCDANGHQHATHQQRQRDRFS